jgi:alpha-beta hydrolase superfamily lysophospholipase
MKYIRKILLCISIVSVSLACTSINPTVDETESYRVSLWKEIPPLQSTTMVCVSDNSENNLQTYYGSALQQYFTEFDNHMETYPAFQRTFGWIALTTPWENYSIFVHILIPIQETPLNGTCYLFHGYASDSSRLTGITRALLYSGRVVVLIDLPGHGLSSGIRGDVPDFSVYGDTVQAVLRETTANLVPPFIGIGHSTGALAIIDYSSRYVAQFDKTILCAPLIRIKYWNLSRFGRWITKPWVYSTKAFSNTPLGLRIFPVHWFDALQQWERRMSQQKDLQLPPTLIIQPLKDTVVNSNYNAQFIQNRSSTTVIQRIDGIDHYEFDSRNPDQKLLNYILFYLDNTWFTDKS